MQQSGDGGDGGDEGRSGELHWNGKKEARIPLVANNLKDSKALRFSAPQAVLIFSMRSM